MTMRAAGKIGFKLQPNAGRTRAGRPCVNPRVYGRESEMGLLNHMIQWCGVVAILLAMAWAMMRLALMIVTQN